MSWGEGSPLEFCWIPEGDFEFTETEYAPIMGLCALRPIFPFAQIREAVVHGLNWCLLATRILGLPGRTVTADPYDLSLLEEYTRGFRENCPI